MKTKPISIRFDEEKLKFFQEKFPEINKPQKVVDYFLDNFWWRHHQSEVSPSTRKYPLSENEAIAAPISVRDVENHDPDKKIAPIQRKTTPAVNIKNFTNDQNTNKVVKVEGEPVRQPGEDAIDFAIRKNEWKLKNQQQ